MIIKRRRTKHFAVVPNEVLEDRRLSIESRGMLAYLLSRPNDWETRLSQLRTEFGCGKERVERMMRELLEAGYATRSLVHAPDGTLGGYDYTITDDPALAPQAENPTTDASPQAGNPQAVEPSAANPTTDLVRTPTKDGFDQTEREGAREGAKEAEAESRRLWAALKADYPGAAKDNLADAERLFMARTPAAQRKSVESLPAWNAYIGPNPRRRVMLQDYVRDARWEMIPADVKVAAAKAAAPDTVFLDPFKRPWWWMFGRTPAGPFLRKRVDMARNMAIGWPVPADKVAEIEAAAERDLAGVKVDTEHFRAWRSYYRSIGVDMPIPDKVEWVFLPTHGPPESDRDDLARGGVVKDREHSKEGAG